MKKFAQIALLAGIAASSVALAEFSVTEVPVVNAGTHAQVGIYKEMNSVYNPLSGNQISKNDPDQHLCWTAISDTPIFKTGANVKEIFKSPASANFNDSKLLLKSSLDGKSHTLSGMLEGIAGGMAIERCWHFEPSDPTGDYTLHVEVNGSVLVQYQFVVTP